MARQVRQVLPKAPPAYDQDYIAQLAEAVNNYMLQATAPAEVIAARFIMVDPLIVDPSGKTPNSIPSTSGLATGTIYIYPIMPAKPGQPGNFMLSIVTEDDPK